ncbi:hypothetical protein ACJMK2_025847 [Sinanodonta woodiana]|uniref:EI24 n=1 Tax=Sinanodonta woodiana TaxID=1069815 RepID=A0ABD3XJN0_SINWO
MSNTFQHICLGIVNGFRDNVLGALKVYKMDAKTETEPTKKSEEELTTLARRRAVKKPSKEKENSKERAPRITQRIFLCCAWNGGIFWMSILLFNSVLLPGLQWLTILLAGHSSSVMVWGWIGPVLSWVFSALWILPLFVLTKVVNNFWFQDIADAAYRKSRGRPQLPNISVFIADMVFSLLMQSLFLMQGMIAHFLPIPAVGQVIGVLHMCLLYSLYSFEYKWINMGLEVHQRVSIIEMKWPYFCGFGLPMAILTSLPSSFVVSGCVFSILFPLSIVSANEADENNHRLDYYQLKLFGPVIRISNALFNHSFKGQRSRRSVTTDASNRHGQTSETSTSKR